MYSTWLPVSTLCVCCCDMCDRSRTCSWPASIFALKKTRPFWLKYRQDFQPVSSYYRRTLYRTCVCCHNCGNVVRDSCYGSKHSVQGIMSSSHSNDKSNLPPVYVARPRRCHLHIWAIVGRGGRGQSAGHSPLGAPCKGLRQQVKGGITLLPHLVVHRKGSETEKRMSIGRFLWVQSVGAQGCLSSLSVLSAERCSS